MHWQWWQSQYSGCMVAWVARYRWAAAPRMAALQTAPLTTARNYSAHNCFKAMTLHMSKKKKRIKICHSY